MRRVTLTVILLALASPSFAQFAAAPQPQQGQQGQQGQQVATPQTPAPTPPAGQQGGRGPVAPVATTPRPPMPMVYGAPGLPAIASNIRLELTITDTYTGTPAKKTVSMLVMNGTSGMIRTSNQLSGYQAGLDIDASAQVHANGLITVRVTFQYTPLQVTEGGANGTRTTRPAELHESLNVILQDGKPLLVSQSADPSSDRKVTVELTATVLK